MMQKTKLTKAIALAVTGVALTVGATVANASATTMYNTFLTYDPAVSGANGLNTNTDGWTRIYDDGTTSPGVATGPESQGNKGAIVPWVGTTGGVLPFNYAGSSSLNWAVNLGAAGDSATVSAADALAKYSATVEIDTGGGAWSDTSTPTTGWKHQTDIGLISSAVDQNVTLNLTTLGNLLPSTFSEFGVTVFDGMDTNTGNYSHHGAWNNPAASKPYTADNPFGTTGLTNIGYSNNVDGLNGYTFTAQAGHIYSIYLGGVGFSKWNTGIDNYALNLTTSAVPLPGAVWLFGTALAGFVGLRRRKTA